MKRLVLLRHAKSDWDADYGADHDRPLNDRGVRSAEAMGRFLAEVGQVPDTVISSTAVRARTTAELAIAAGGWNRSIRTDERIYGGSAGDILLLQGACHNPTGTDLSADQWSEIAALVNEEQFADLMKELEHREVK